MPHKMEMHPAPAQPAPLTSTQPPARPWRGRPRTTPRATSRATSLPERIDGLDIPSGLQLMCNNKDLYLSSLRMFVASQHDAIRDIRLLLQTGDSARAVREADKLKTQAGYLGAKLLQMAAGELEATLCGKYPATGELDAALNHASTQLVQVLGSVRLAVSPKRRARRLKS